MLVRRRLRVLLAFCSVLVNIITSESCTIDSKHIVTPEGGTACPEDSIPNFYWDQDEKNILFRKY